ncbi:sigma-E processing peptidase SpoIIGA [Clostridium carnis]
MVVYIDILLFENFIVNLFLLLATMKILRYEYRKTIYISAIVGSCYTISLFLDVPFITSLPAKILVAIIMILIAIKNINIGNIIKSVVTFFVISFTLCGLCFSFSLMESQYSIYTDFIISDYSIKYLLISLMILYIVIVRLVDYFRERALVKGFIYDVEISHMDVTFCIKGFLDTGNELREPVTNLPCIIIDESCFGKVKMPNDKLFYVSYSTIGEEGKLKGFKGEKIRVRGPNEEWRSVDAIICECKNKINKENEFNALLSRGIV